MPKLSKKQKQEWDYFINPETGRRTYNGLCRKCRNACKQSYRTKIVCCPKYKPKRSVISKDGKQTLAKNLRAAQTKKMPISAPNQYRKRGDAMNKYFKISDAKNFAFYKVPKALFEEKYKSVSTDAKILYGLLLDRMYLSVKNN